MSPEQLERVERWVNEGIWQNTDVRITEKKYADAVQQGAMALFGEKYGDVVRVVEIPLRSTELCGGCHVKNTGQILLFRIVSESGVSAGVRRIVAVTGPKAYQALRENERALEALGAKLKVNLQASGVAALDKRVDALVAEQKKLEKQLAEARRGGSSQLSSEGTEGSETVGAWVLLSRVVHAADIKDLQAMGDAVRSGMPNGVGLLAAAFDEGKGTLVVVVGDALREKGVSAGDLVKAIGAKTGIRGGGKPHLAQAGVAADQVEATLAAATDVVRAALGGVA